MSIESGSVLIIDVNGVLMAVTPGSSIPVGTSAFLVAGTDGTNARVLSTDTSGREIVVGAGVSGTPAGGVLTIQGITGGTPIPVSGATNPSIGTTGSAVPTSATLIGGTDGTNLIAVKIKDASTAAAASDPSLVVAFSPNSALPTGSNVIGAVTQSGTWTNVVTQSTASNLNALVAQGAAGTAAGGWYFKLTDGTNTAPTFDVASRAGFQKITDGTNTAAVKAASTAPVASDPSLVVVLSPNQPSIPVTVGAGTDRTSTGSITSTQNVAINTMASGTCGIQVTGTWGGTLVFEGSVDNGTTWVSIPAVVPVTGVEVTSTTANGVWSAACAGFAQVRVRGNTVTSGSATIFLDSATGTMVVSLGEPLPAGTNTIGAVNQGSQGSIGSYWYVRTTDGTNLSPTMDAVTRNGFQAITDGTHGPAAVKAATIAAVASDPSLVVAFSPNSSIPAGSNVIGAVTQSGTWSVTCTQTTAANLNATVVQATASNLNATVVGSGSAGSPASGVVTVQGVTGMTPVAVSPKTATTSTITTVAASVSSVSLLASNSSRLSALITNDGSAIMYIALAASASATSYTYKLFANSQVVLDGNWTGAVSALWSSATGNACITELTP
jgi:hypothetical protein